MAVPPHAIPRVPAMRLRRLRLTLAAVLGVLGFLALAEFGVTMLWQEPITALEARAAQNRLSKALDAVPTPRWEVRARQRESRRKHAELLRRHREHVARHLDRHTPQGHPLGRIRIPAIGATFVVVQGTATGDLELGPGHYLGTKLPGQRGTVAIAGHRTTWLAPFRNIDALHHGNHIILQMPYGTYTYVVDRSRVVDPSDVSVLRNTPHDRLVLSACTPLFSAAHRLVVFAHLAHVVDRSR